MREMADRRRVARGFSLVELMVAMLIGTLVTVGAVGIFMTNRKSYAATESLGRIQEGARMAFELMARDIRDADGTACAQPGPAVAGQAPMLPMANIVAGTPWWKPWGDGLQGYDNGGLAGTVAGTDALEVRSASDNAISVVSYAANKFTLTRAATDFAAGDAVVACDNSQASVFRIDAPVGEEVTVSSDAALNCSQNLGVSPGACSVVPYAYASAGRPAMLAKLNAARWYVKANGRGGNSLYRQVLGQESEIPEGTSTPANGVGGLQLQYLLQGATTYVGAGSITTGNWKRVKAVRVELEFEGQQGNDADRIKAGTDGQGLRRSIRHIVTLRNRT